MITLRKVLIVVFLLLLTTLPTFTRKANANTSNGGSRQPPDSNMQGSYELKSPEQIVTGSSTALLIEDVIPWDGDESNYWDANQEALSYLGITYDLIGSANIPSDLSSYKFVILASTQPGSTYANVEYNMAKIGSYVWDGGIYLAHACDLGWWDLPYGYGSSWHNYMILPGWPGGIGRLNYFSNDIHINDPTSPVVAGLNDQYFDGWTYSTHGYFVNVPPSANAVMVADNGEPTYIIYQYGSGFVFATMQTIEWGYGPFIWYWVGNWRPQFLLNELHYALTLPPGSGFSGTLPSSPPNLDPPGGGAGGGGVGGAVVPIDKLGLLAPYVGSASTILVASVAVAIYVTRVKHRKAK